MNRLYDELYHVVEAQNRIKRSIFRMLEARDSDGDSDDGESDDSDDLTCLRPTIITELEINGIREEQGQSLQYILSRLSRHMFSEVFPSQVERIYRLRTAKKPRPIIVTMKSPVTVRELLIAYTEYNKRNRHSNLNTRDLGFTGMKLPVLLSEHPSRLNKPHRRAVRQKIRKYKHKKRARRTAAKASRKHAATKAISTSTTATNNDGDNHSNETLAESVSPESVAGHSSASHTADEQPTASNMNNNSATKSANFFLAQVIDAELIQESSDEDDEPYSPPHILPPPITPPPPIPEVTQSYSTYVLTESDLAFEEVMENERRFQATFNYKIIRNPPSYQVTSLRDLALEEVNKVLFG